MNLKQFEKVGRGTRTRYITSVQDTMSSEDYQLVVTGSDRLIKRILKDADFDIKIDSKATEDDWAAIQKPLWEQQKVALSSLTSLEDMGGFFKHKLMNPSIENSIFMSLHRIHGEGSLFYFSIPFELPRALSIYIFFLFACDCSGSVSPVTGDADLYLTINNPFAVPVATGILGGLARDSIFYSGNCSYPWTHFFPTFRVYGFTLTVGGFYGWSYA